MQPFLPRQHLMVCNMSLVGIKVKVCLAECWQSGLLVRIPCVSSFNTLLCPQGKFWSYINAFASWCSKLTAERYCTAAATASAASAAGSHKIKTKKKKREKKMRNGKSTNIRRLQNAGLVATGGETSSRCAWSCSTWLELASGPFSTGRLHNNNSI